MASAAFSHLLTGIDEVAALQKANPSPREGGGFTRPQISRAIGRSQVLLLSGHFERYLYTVNEEAVDFVIRCAPEARLLSDDIRLLHTRGVIDALARTEWKNRAEQLREYSARDAGIWVDAEPVSYLSADRLLMWMRTPTCKSIVRLFNMWGIGDIFATITKTKLNRQRLWLKISELVEKRNNIAHGDLTVEARYLDVVQYKSAVRTFCSRADRRMARRLAGICASSPW